MRNIVDKIIETKLNLFRYIATTQNFRRAVGCLVSQVEQTGHEDHVDDGEMMAMCGAMCSQYPRAVRPPKKLMMTMMMMMRRDETEHTEHGSSI